MHHKEKNNNCSLAELFPEKATLWHPAKNGSLRPDIVQAYSHKKVWWKCSRGHQWQAPVVAVVKRKNNCLICENIIAHKNYNLKTINPSLAKQWHQKKNGLLKPVDVAPNSKRKVWWKCNKGHEWVVSISQRHSGNSGCPYCSGRMATVKNNLAVTNPEIARLWHPEKNKPVTPYDVKRNSSWWKYWWQCSKGHE